MFRRTTRVPIWLIILAGALGVRMVGAFLVQQRVSQTPGKICLINGDADGYWKLASKIARGEEYAIYEPPRRLLRMPGFPLFLAAGMKLFGEQGLPLRCLLALLGTAGCGLVYLFGRQLFDEETAIWSSLLCAVSPLLAGFSVLFLSETLFAVAMLASLLALAHLILPKSASEPNASRVRWGAALLAGILCGVATLVRPTWLLVGPVFVLVQWWLAPKRDKALREGLALLVGLSVTMLPWTLRNWSVTGHFIPTTLWVGASLYDGLNPDATGASDMRFIEADGIYQRLSEYDADQHYRQKALQFVREHPGKSLALGFSKLARYFSLAPSAETVANLPVRLAIGAWSLAFLLLAGFGVWTVRRQVWLWLLPAGGLVYFALVHSVFVGSLRYRLPAEYPLCVLAAVAIVRLRRGSLKPLGSSGS